MSQKMSQKTSRSALLGKKLGMSQVWDENGFFVPVTLVDVSTNVVTTVKTEDSDGYNAVQLGYGQIDPTKVTKPLAGHFAKAGVTPRRHLAEVRTENAAEFEPGQELGADLFGAGVVVDVTGTTKGKGFAGTIKRWGFKSYRRTHGSHKNERRPGSVGACATPSRILKGKRMAGRMGHVTSTVQNLTVVSSDVENGIIALKGAVPGPKGAIVLVRSAVKGA
jgi:large subunit ribosomal protein L3